jgi:hypothetical protein
MNSYFYGRAEIVGQLRRRVADLKEGYRQNMALLGSLYVGKTTVLQEFLASFDDSAIIPAYLDLENRDVNYLASKLIRSIFYHYSRSKGLPLHEDANLLAESVRPHLPLSVGQASEVRALIEKGNIAGAYDALISLPEVFTQESGLFCIVILDEFQAMNDFGVTAAFRKLADRIATQKRCLYIISSSYEEQAKKILSEELTLLFGNFELISIEPFDLKTSQGFIETRMGLVKMGLQLRNFLADFTGGSPLYLDMLLQELINLSSIYKQQEIYAPLVVQAVENMVFSRWGALSRHFELIINSICGGRSNRLVTDLMIGLANGSHKAKDLVDLLGAKPYPVTQKLNYLVEEDIVERNGSYYHIKDKLMRYWVKYVFQKRIRAIEIEPGRLKKEFKDELTRALSEFQVVSRKDLSSRITELLYCFDNELLSLQGRKYRLPTFRDVKVLKMRQRGGNLVEVLQAETAEGPWLLVLRKDPLAESDINAVAEEARKMGVRPRRCVIVSLSDLEDGVKLRALEERMWVWNEAELNSLMSLYDKPYIVP